MRGLKQKLQQRVIRGYADFMNNMGSGGKNAKIFMK